MPLTLEGDTLGKKHKHFNKLVEDAIANNHYELSKIDSEDSDIDNLLKIDIASKTRNVDYIIEAMKSKDMLYASRAIKKSTWLITDQKYANIINPVYLHEQILPNMNTKSVNKWLLHIRLHLKEENRVEAFYKYLKETDESYKWLQNCSIPFIENVIKNERRVPLSFFKRLCRRSTIFFKYYKRVEKGSEYDVGMEMLLLIKSHPAEILNLYEDEHIYFPVIGKKKTEILMKTCPQRILDNFAKYAYGIDLAMVAKHLKKAEIKAFLYKHMKNDKLENYLSDYNHLRHFVKNMPKEERFEFIKKTFINKPKPRELEMFCTEKEEISIHCTIESYYWYEFAPFEVAFTELKKLIRAESSPSVRCAILSMLIKCTRQNPTHIKTLLKFYYQKHINEAFKFKIKFINKLLSQTLTHKFDSEAWNVLDQLFHSMEVYTESENNVQMCLKSIILYKVLNDEMVPEIVEKKIEFDTFKNIQGKLNQEQKDKMFTYLLNCASTKIQNNATKESDYNETIEQLKNILTLLIDWKKDIHSYPFILNKIQELIKVKKQENSSEINLSGLYNLKKSWRKAMFEDSLTLCLSEEVCLNALKHKPQLLMNHDKELETLRTNDTVSLRGLLTKIRVYWPQLTQHWTNAYLQNLNSPSGQKALMRGLFMLLPQKQIIEMAKKYVPEVTKVIWGETDQAEINIRKNIAKNLHVARPLIPLTTVLWYAKGDYLQYVVPSLNSVLHNLSRAECREHLPKLLEAPVSLQKFGLHLAFVQLKSDELKTIFSKIWNTTKNCTIRSVLFTHTNSLICKVKNPTVEKELWDLLSMFIDNLSPDDSNEIYQKLSEVKNVPLSIQGEFFMKSYVFLTSLPEKTKCEEYVKDLLEHAPKIMESLDEDFVVDKILSPAETKFCSYRSEYIDLFASFILCGKTEEKQLQKFRKVVVPAMKQAIRSWNNVREGQYYVKNNFKFFLRTLVWNFRKYAIFNKIIIPSKLFTEIKIKMEEIMPLGKNYVLYTSWKLITEYVKLLDANKSFFSSFESSKISESDFGNSWMSEEIEAVWKDIHFQVLPAFGPIIVKCLKEDTEQYFPTMCWLFNDAFDKMLQDLSFHRCALILETLKYMLDDHDCIPIYLVVINAIPKYIDDEFSKSIRSEIRKKITSHPSEEVQMHYHHAFRDIPEDKSFDDEFVPKDDPCDKEFIPDDKSYHDDED